jgi:hypothetical protein
MKNTFWFNLTMIFLVSIGCSWSVDEQTENQAPKQTYAQFKDSVSVLLKSIERNDFENRSNLLFSLISEDLVAHWVGTPWDFNGTTRAPNQGTIACGYFVTNTLSDLGFDIQRVKLAQAASSEMIKTLCIETKWISGFDNFSAYMNKQNKNAIYIVGLDFHTGFIIKKGAETYFFHSNYIQAEGVIIERVEQSKALLNNQAFYIGNLTGNKELLKTWGASQ